MTRWKKLTRYEIANVIRRYREDAETFGKWANSSLAHGNGGAARVYKMTQEQYTAFADKLQRVLDGKHKRIAVE